MTGLLVTLMVITQREKIDNTLFIKKMARGKKVHTKDREKGRQLAERLEKKYNNNTLLRLRKKIPKSIEEKNAKELEAANDYVDFYERSCVAIKENRGKKSF